MLCAGILFAVVAIQQAQANRCDVTGLTDPSGGYDVPDSSTGYLHVTTCQAFGTNAGKTACESLFTEGPLGETAPCRYTPDSENLPEGPGSCEMLDFCFEFEPLSQAQWQFIDTSATSSCIPYAKNPCFITDQMIMLYFLNPDGHYSCTAMNPKPWSAGGGPGTHYRGFPDVGQYLTRWIRTSAEAADDTVPYLPQFEGIDRKPSELMSNVTVTHALESLPLPPVSMDQKAYKNHPLWKNKNAFITPTADCQECKLTFETEFGERSVCCPWLIGESYTSLEDCNLHLQADEGIVYFYNIDHPDMRDQADNPVDWQPRTHHGIEAALHNFEIYYAFSLLIAFYLYDEDGNYDREALEAILIGHPDVRDDLHIDYVSIQEATSSTSILILPESFAPTRAPSTLSPTCSPTTLMPSLSPTPSPTESPTSTPTRTPTDDPTRSPTQSPTDDPTTSPTQSPTDDPTASPTQSPTDNPTTSPTQSPTDDPTTSPTQSPTDDPTRSPTQSTCQHTWHTTNASGFVERTKANSYAIDCRQGFQSIIGWPKEGWRERSYTWPLNPIDKTRVEYAVGQYCTVENVSGGKHAQKRNPYMTCVSKVDDTGAALTITIDECFALCGKDQRCQGIEYPEDGSQCRLIDDDVDDIVPNFVPLPNLSGSPAVQCFAKTDQCNPSFESSDLDEELLTCYCHNQSHGFLTKNVERTVEATRYCGSMDTEEEIELWFEETEAIRRAQANRMFHLCDAWCLFDVDNPREKYWFYNPRSMCWDKQGTKGYCYRQHVAVNSIEFQYVVNRANKMCGRSKDIPTFAPTTRGVTWVLERGLRREFCSTVCELENMTCSGEDFHLLFNSQIEDHSDRIVEIYRSAGVECTELAEGGFRSVNPSYHSGTGVCILRNSQKNSKNPCRGRSRGAFLRLCPCV